jgi:Protein of unknown function (DUF732)
MMSVMSDNFETQQGPVEETGYLPTQAAPEVTTPAPTAYSDEGADGSPEQLERAPHRRVALVAGAILAAASAAVAGVLLVGQPEYHAAPVTPTRAAPPAASSSAPTTAPELSQDDRYLALLAQHGMTSDNPGNTVHAAYAVCAKLASGSTVDQVVDLVFTGSKQNGGATRSAEAEYVAITVGVYCPQFGYTK